MAWLDAAILYCDISGYTSLTNQTRNETVARLLIGFHSSMVRATNQCHGKVISFSGDRVMSVFMADDSRKAVDNAITCALSMHSIVRVILPQEFSQRNFKQTLYCTIGLDYGRVLMGEFGAGNSTDIILVGDAANLAAKLQAKAGRNETWVSDKVYRNSPSWMKSKDWHEVKLGVKGIGNIPAWKTKCRYDME